LLALREGGLLQEAVSGLGVEPDVVIADATGRDHPRGAGLVIHLGAACGLPTIGVTDRPLLATGPEPGIERGAAAELRLEGELVGYRLRTRAGARPVVIHAGWRVGADTGCAVVLRATVNSRTPQSLRQARRLAPTARSTDSGLLRDVHRGHLRILRADLQGRRAGRLEPGRRPTPTPRRTSAHRPRLRLPPACAEPHGRRSARTAARCPA